MKINFKLISLWFITVTIISQITRFKRQIDRWGGISKKVKVSRCGTIRYNILAFAWSKSKGKAVPLQAWSGPECSRKLKFPDFMTTAQGGGKVGSLTHRPPLPLGNTYGTPFCWRLSRPQGHNVTGRIMSLKNSNDTIGNRTRDLPVICLK
jgi:hypothetical protein